MFIRSVVLLLLLGSVSNATPSLPGVASLCFSRGGAIYTMNLKTGAIKRVALGFDPNISRDGSEVAFTVSRDKDPDVNRIVQVKNLSTGKVRAFPSLAKNTHYGPLWSPKDARLIALHVFSLAPTSRWDACLLDTSTGTWKNLTAGIKSDGGVYLSSWTAGGRSIICHDLHDVYEVDLDGRVIRTLPIQDMIPSEYVSSSTKFSVLSNGMILFDTNLPHDGEPADENVGIFTVDLVNNVVNRVTPQRFQAMDPVPLPAPDDILFSALTMSKRGQSRSDIYKISVTTNKSELVLRNASDVSYSVGP
jgi:hypothetical protein